MKKYLHACFLAFICLYRSKYTGLRRSCTDHPPRVRGKDSPYPDSKETTKPILIWLYDYLFGNMELKEPGCADINRFRAVVFLGAHHPETLSQLLNLASFVLFIRCLTLKVVRNLFSRSQKSGLKKIPNRHLRDASRGVCVPSFSMPKKLLIMVMLLLPLAGVAQDGEQDKGAPVVFYGEINSPFLYDSMRIFLFENHLVSSPKLFEHQAFKAPIEEEAFILGTPMRRVFRFETAPISNPSYLTLMQGDRNLLTDFLAMPGDSVYMLIDDYTKNIFFSGPAAPAYQLQRELIIQSGQAQFDFPREINSLYPEGLLDEENNKQLVEQNRGKFGKPVSINKLDLASYFDTIKKSFPLQQKQIPNPVFEKYANDLDLQTMELIKAEHLAKEAQKFFQSFMFLYQTAQNRGQLDILDSLDKFYQENLKAPPVMDFSEQTLYYAAHYPSVLVDHARIAGYFEPEPVYDMLLEGFDGKLREKVLTLYLHNHFKHLENNMDLLGKTLELVETPWLRSGLEKIQNNLHVGAVLPEYPLQDLNGNEVSLTDLKGKILLVDFWYTGCGACVMLYENVLSKVENHFEGNENFQLVSINTDKSPGSWKKSVAGGKYTSNHARNLYSEGRNHPLLVHYNIFSYPHQLLVNKESALLKSGGFPKTAADYIELIEGSLSEQNKKETNPLNP